MSHALKKIYGVAFVYSVSAISGEQTPLFIKCPTFQGSILLYFSIFTEEKISFRAENSICFEIEEENWSVPLYCKPLQKKESC